MSRVPLEEVDHTLLLISEARERAERAARSIGGSAEPHVVEALLNADRALLSLHSELMRAVYFPGERDQQLKLAESA